MKPRIGFFDFTCCEGCQLTILNLEDEFLELLELVEIVEFREIMTGEAAALDIAFVEGSIASPDEAARLQRIRERSRTLVALGACADNAGVNALSHFCPPDELSNSAYGRKVADMEQRLPRPLECFVPVDARVPGCPIDGREFLGLLQALLVGRTPELPAYAVCVECKLREYPCTFDQGTVCLGPVTRAGCNALCLAGGDRCRGCRGLVDNPRSQPYRRILEQHGLTVEDILAEFRVFNLPPEKS
ncbi:NADH:ubiquinone oxidoreductase [Geoalkalibacter halelectricus]|uniref:NADH:ubiquinone oxidoreductase n=1 Tax=Geoalkalibacter halelectricus TaxID=2847045 RepID=A0ABY5ZLP1_9BACT|nr:NADH:ubiquinone oxidoreductase [Geoalkalibacter halelectricus]MDO3377757.1 NADH:ubiquinone oxidoreductase [Geoalkalibacter halelectricus]UWZ78649.1 NADH:ubiquinone oxidoreductase [Geoalkalibacter halelectricus]